MAVGLYFREFLDSPTSRILFREVATSGLAASKRFEWSVVDLRSNARRRGSKGGFFRITCWCRMSRCGPFEILVPDLALDNSGCSILSLAVAPLPGEIQPEPPIEREFDCCNYTTCLGLAAALNWGSFSCSNCCGEINMHLLWRAHHACRKDAILSDICRLPPIAASVSNANPRTDTESANTRLRQLRSL